MTPSGVGARDSKKAPPAVEGCMNLSARPAAKSRARLGSVARKMRSAPTTHSTSEVRVGPAFILLTAASLPRFARASACRRCSTPRTGLGVRRRGSCTRADWIPRRSGPERVSPRREACRSRRRVSSGDLLRRPGRCRRGERDSNRRSGSADPVSRRYFDGGSALRPRAGTAFSSLGTAQEKKQVSR